MGIDLHRPSVIVRMTPTRDPLGIVRIRSDAQSLAGRSARRWNAWMWCWRRRMAGTGGGRAGLVGCADADKPIEVVDLGEPGGHLREMQTRVGGHVEIMAHPECDLV